VSLALRVLEVASGPARGGARRSRPCCVSAGLARNSLIMGSLDDAVDLPLARVHVVQPVVGTDRVGVRWCRGAVARAGKRHTWSPRRPLHLTRKGSTCAQTCDDGRTNGCRTPLAHLPASFSSASCRCNEDHKRAKAPPSIGAASPLTGSRPC